MIPRLRAPATAVLLLGAIFLSEPGDGPLRPPPAYAATITVNTLLDNIGFDGACSLPEAIINANTNAITLLDCGPGAAVGVDVINFSVDGTIVLGSVLPAITDPAGVRIDGVGRTVTVSGNDLVRHFDVSAVGHLELRNLTISGAFGVVSSPGAVSNLGTLAVANCAFEFNQGALGGAIWTAGPTTITNSTFRQNSAQGGGAINVEGPGNLTVTSSTFSNNTATTAGGAIRGGIGSPSMTLTDSTFDHNTVTSGSSGAAGGALWFGAVGSLSIARGTFIANSARSGGAILAGDDWTATGTVFSNNTATVDGGAVYSIANSAILSNTRFTANAAGAAGGALRHAGTTLDVVESTLELNSAADGGAIASGGVALNVAKSTLTGNVATGLGGSLYQTGGQSALVNSTVTGNSASTGGGVWTNVNFPALTHTTVSGNTASVAGGGIAVAPGAEAGAYNTIIAGNSAPVAPDCAGSMFGGSPNLVQTVSGCSFSFTVPIIANPLLGPLLPNGGQTHTRALLQGSPALDAGDTVWCSPGPLTGSDQRAVPRPQGTGCDLGAYEAAQLAIQTALSLAGEGDSGSSAAPKSVILSAAPPAGGQTTVQYSTSSVTATAGVDYTPIAGTLVFNPGETVKLLSVNILGDTTFEPDEEFSVVLSLPQNAVIVFSPALVRILNDDPLPALSVTNVSVVEGNSGDTPAVFNVTLSNPSYQAITVTRETSDNTALAPADYQALPPAPLVFAPGEVAKPVPVQVHGDNTLEPNETFTLKLTAPVNATIATGVGTATIQNDDVVGGRNLRITEGDTSIKLAWDGGNAQTSYVLLVYNTSTAVATTLALPGATILYSDGVAPNVVYCYVLAALDGAVFLGLSDLECGMVGVGSGTVVAGGLTLALNQTANATLTWNPPLGGVTSYLLGRIPLDGTPPTYVPLPGTATTAVQAVVSAGMCFQLVAFNGAAFGTTDVVCGVPGISTLSGSFSPGARVLESDLSALLNQLFSPFRDPLVPQHLLISTVD